MPVTITAAAGTYCIMLAGYFLHRMRIFHVLVMSATLLFDIGMPIYLITHRHWYHRLIVQGDITSFLVWMHLGLVFGIYALEGLQVVTARKILQGDQTARADHHQQGKTLLFARALVIFTGAILANP